MNALSPLNVATLVSATAAGVALVLATRAGPLGANPQLWAVVIGTCVAAGGLLFLAVARAAYRTAISDRSAQLPGSESLRPVPVIVSVVGATILIELVGSSLIGVSVYGDRPASGPVGPGASWQSAIFALWIALFVLPLLATMTVIVISVERIARRAGFPAQALRFAGSAVIGAATLALVVAAGWYVALAAWAALPIVLVAAIATAWAWPRR